MKLLRAVGTCFLLCALGCLLQVLPVFSQTAAAGLVHTGNGKREGSRARADRRGLSRVYWQTHETNETAMKLYDKVAEKSGFLIYRKML
jgi:hypothetical protein